MRANTRRLILLLSAVGLVLSTTANATFIEETQFGSGLTIPVAWADYDNDGDLDLAVANYNQPNQLFINNGDGSYTEEAQFGSGATFAVSWGDYDNDGDPDLAVGNGLNQTNYLFVNNGDGSFTLQTEFGNNRTTSVAWADYDLDGDLDVAVGNGILSPEEQNLLFINNNDGTFTEDPQFGEGRTGTLVWGDCNHDGYPDLAVGNGGFGWIGQNYLYINNGDGSFTERAEFGMGDTPTMAWGDYDNDGDLDLAVGNWDAGQNYLYINNGLGTFTEQPQFGIRDPNTIAWGDHDNDGDLDLAVGNGDFQNAEQNYLYDNNGNGSFTEIPEFGVGSTDGVAWGDCDGDLDLDLAVGNEHTPTTNYLYVNQDDDGASLVVHLEGQFHATGSGFSNRDGIGAKVAVYEAGFVADASHLLGYREIWANGGFSSQNAIDAHFGLPSAATVDLRIIWPGSNGERIIQVVEGVAVGQRLVVEETGSPARVPEPAAAPLDQGFLRAVPNPMDRHTRIELLANGAPIQGVEICNIEGRVVQTLTVRGPDGVGRYFTGWDGLMRNGEPAPAGIYLAREQHGAIAASTRILLLR